MVKPFTFEVRLALATDEDFDGDVTLAGVRLDGGNLAVGDSLLVPLKAGGHARATCAAFPLMSFDDRELRAVSVIGVALHDVAIGGLAQRV